ncbi:DNA internalization-like competence protein ComEC/Rec2 [Anopheles sinensis]|uniref:DNA internalization-like competence protein ComEC/Rec2 n=1 Tax=Anopheles sinensis TaxID=74873 RepID=A0A084WSX0_ANOSI|nr:DNA internalization-like competence protein ComEC/Rec2 [Anopheles sinensis]
MGHVPKNLSTHIARLQAEVWRALRGQCDLLCFASPLRGFVCYDTREQFYATLHEPVVGIRLPTPISHKEPAHTHSLGYAAHVVLAANKRAFPPRGTGTGHSMRMEGFHHFIAASSGRTISETPFVSRQMV